MRRYTYNMQYSSHFFQLFWISSDKSEHWFGNGRLQTRSRGSSSGAHRSFQERPRADTPKHREDRKLETTRQCKVGGARNNQLAICAHARFYFLTTLRHLSGSTCERWEARWRRVWLVNWPRMTFQRETRL